MKSQKTFRWSSLSIAGSLLLTATAFADPATLLFQDDFSGGIPGWTAVQPAGAYIEGPMLWQFDKDNNAFSEQSNIYTDSATASTSRRTVMLISDAVAPSNFTYTARLTAGDDDGFGLIWSYENEGTFYRAAFARQNRFTVGWPYQGIMVDRMSNSVPIDISGPNNSFINTGNRPFDVTISVTNGLLTIVVVDNPLVSPVTFNLVTDQPLPVSPVGRVGIFSWGQAGTTPRAFRVQNPVLNGTNLDTAAISQVLSNWSFTVTPSSTNDYPIDTGLWSQALGPNGDRGMMIENNDSAPENGPTSSTNTPVNAAVAGDVNWSNYVYSVRFKSADNDGFGMFLRWQDRTNWYRIGFRAQASTSGIKQGISVQKNVNRTFDQMLSTTSFLPPINSAFDVHAAIRDNNLQIVCIVNPDSASPTISSFGPIDMSASTKVPANLATGRIGVFSWAQYGDNNLPDTTAPDDGTAVDWVRVRKVNGEGLLVSSAYGTPNPPVGLNDLPASTVTTARVDNVVLTAPGIRQLSTGWSGAGSVPGTGATNEAVFTLTQFSLITWKWQTQYLLTINSTAGGSASSSAGPWINAISNVTVSATANPGFVFIGWTGDNISSTTNLALQMTRPFTLTANFAVDSDGDGLPDNWELQYFGNLSQNATGDPDGDGRNNLTEFQNGTNPNSAESLVLADGLSSRWINEARDRALPGWFTVTNFGGGFRGLWEVSNQNRSADSAGPDDFPFITTTNFATNASFQGPCIVVRSNVWNAAWENTFSLSSEFSFGDNDGNCLYFRYSNRSNWYRVTLCGNDAPGLNRPLTGVSLQKRINGAFSVIDSNYISGPFSSVFPDPLDTIGFKKLRVTVNGTNDTFEVRVIGWNAFLSTPDWDPNYEVVLTFTENSLPTGRIAIGSWGQGAFGAWNATNGNPVGIGFFADNIVLAVNGANVFTEDWETAPLHDIPAGWENPFAGSPGLSGDWHLSAHGTIANFTLPFGTPQSGTVEFPKADGEGPILLAPPLTNANYLLELGIHPLDDGGMGFVYDFKDTNNYARVLFNSRAPASGDLVQGINISRKSNGVWSSIVVGDNTFVYAPGRPFDMQFANNNGAYTLTATPADNPATVYHWNWTDQSSQASNRVGLAIWSMPDAHFTYLRASSLLSVPPATQFKITNVSLNGGNVVLDISKPSGSSYHVLRASNVLGPYVTNAANQTGAQYSEPVSPGARFYRLQLLP
jgi:uncharacterized repeat protein (TIGR02543 family)